MEKNRKRLVIRIILIIIVAIILLLIVHCCRNYFIGTELMNNRLKYFGSTNYHLTMKTTNETVDIYVKKDKKASFSKRDYDDEAGIKEMAVYVSDGSANVYTKTIDDKNIAAIGVQGDWSVEPYLGQPYSFIDEYEYFLCLISKATVDGKVCYKVGSIFDYHPDFIFEKETGFLVRILDGNYSEEIKYEFDKVEDSIFIEPNLDEYEIIEK